MWKPEIAEYQWIGFTMFAEGVRQIVVRQGVTEGELRDFLAILVNGCRTAMTQALTLLARCGNETSNTST